MQTLSQIRSLLAEKGIHPRHRFGQNFLHDHNFIAKIIEAAEIGRDQSPRPVILEVGPGTGALTEAILEAGAEVIVCEIDRDLASIIEARFGDSLRLIIGDALASKHEINPQVVDAVAGRPFKLVANLPYNIASPLIMTLLIDHASCSRMVVTIQKEVADRLLASPSTKAYGPLGIVAQTLARIERIATVPPSCFWPPPEVTSAIVRIDRLGDDAAVDARRFSQFVTQLFTRRRKQLGSTFGRDDAALPPGVTPQQRPESLTVQQIVRLFEMTETNDDDD